jgi:hypothetical protein
MKVKERIRELNTEFQKSYYDTDAGYFTQVVPQMLEEMEAFMTMTIANRSLGTTMDECFHILNNVKEDMQRIAEHPNPSYATKDNWLNGAKQNVSQALWRFHDHLYGYDARMLEAMS